MEQLRGANAVLTGGSRGIGPYIARALAREGVNLALVARDGAKLEAVRTEVEGLGVRAVAIAADVCRADDRQRLVDEATQALGPIDILINNAGVEPTSPFARLDPETIEATYATNLVAPALLLRAVLPGMIERGRGHIVNVASLAGKVPVPYDSVYSSSKFGLVGLSHAVREELRGTGVGLSVIEPGFVADAGMYADAIAESGVRAPAVAGTSRPEAVAAAVVRAVRRNTPEIIINPVTGRPLVALGLLSPSLGLRLMRMTGVTGLFRQVAERRARDGA